VPPPSFVPVKVTIGAGSNGKSLARSIDWRVKGLFLIWLRVITLSGGVAGAKVDTPTAPSKKMELETDAQRSKLLAR
jgi:hypothetical protein